MLYSIGNCAGCVQPAGRNKDYIDRIHSNHGRNLYAVHPDSHLPQLVVRCRVVMLSICKSCHIALPFFYLIWSWFIGSKLAFQHDCVHCLERHSVLLQLSVKPWVLRLFWCCILLFFMLAKQKHVSTAPICMWTQYAFSFGLLEPSSKPKEVKCTCFSDVHYNQRKSPI